MATPSFVKRLRRNAGNTVRFTTVNNESMTVQVTRVEFDSGFGEYVLVGRDVSNISKNGSPLVEVYTDSIERPVRYAR